MSYKIIKLNLPYWNSEIIHPVLLADEKNLVLVDCGDIKSLENLEREIISNGFKPENLTGIILTHHDFDHMGTTGILKRKYPQIKIYSSAEEEPYISGKKKNLRLVQAERLQKNLSEENQDIGKNFCTMLKKLENVSVDKIIKEGDVLDFCGGCNVIKTFGHTPGHISLYFPKEKILITGDAAVLINGKPEIPNPEYAYNLEDAEKSFEKIFSLGAEKILYYHEN